MDFRGTGIVLAAALTASALAAGESEAAAFYGQAQQQGRAVQTWYVDGVPHTDRRGARRAEYDPETSFFPIGFWGVPAHQPGGEYDWAKLRDLGVNTVWPYPNVKAERAVLDIADEFDMQVIFMHAIADEELTAMKDHHRLLGNVWMDEPIGKLDIPGAMDDLMGKFLAYKKNANALVPSMPVFINDAPWFQPPATDWFVRWNTAGDLACHDNYPVKGSAPQTRTLAHAPNGVPQGLMLTALANRQQKPVWIILGAFEQGTMTPRDPFPFRFPTPDQLRAQVYAALVHGATGIHYFIWDSFISRDGCVVGISPDPKEIPDQFITDSPRSRPATPMQRANALALWHATAAINRELAELAPALLRPTVSPRDLTYAIDAEPLLGDIISPNPVRGLMKRRPETDDYILLNVNLDAVTLNATFRFDRELDSAEVLFGSYPLPVRMSDDRKQVVLRYEAFQAHILRLVFRAGAEVTPVAAEPPAADTVPLPLPAARLWPVGKATAERRENPVLQATTIYQPIVAGAADWSVQWNDFDYPGAKPGAAYDVYLRLRAEGAPGKGPLLTAAWWDGEAGAPLFTRDVRIEDLPVPGEFAWIKVGTVAFPANYRRTTPYLAPAPQSPAKGYSVAGMELRRRK